MATKTFNTRIKNKYGTLESFNESNIVLMQGELAFVTDNNDTQMIYLGDGVTPFTQLTPIFSTAYIVGIDKMNMQEVKLQPNAWVNNEQKIMVTGVSDIETNQLLIPTFSQASRQAALSAGIDFYVSQANEITFTCVNVPLDIITVYVSIFGAKSNDNEDAPILRTPIDDILSIESTNPVQNKIITNKINSMESVLDALSGKDETGEVNLPSVQSLSYRLDGVDETINRLRNYNNLSSTVQHVETRNIGNWNLNDTDVGSTVEIKTVFRNYIPFTVTVSKENMALDLDISAFGIYDDNSIPVLPENLEILHGSWSGKVSGTIPNNTISYFCDYPVIIGTNSNIYITMVPISDTPYTITGNVCLITIGDLEGIPEEGTPEEGTPEEGLEEVVNTI